MSDAVTAEAIRMLYRQARNSAVAALVVTVYMAFTAWPFSDHRAILTWLVCQAVAQLARIGLIAAFHRSDPDDAELRTWARRYTIYMAIAGLLWGATAFLFMHYDEPITIALVLCGLYGITGGSVPGNAYNPPGLYAFALTIFGCVLAHMIGAQSVVYVALGLASFAFAGIMILFCRVQAASIEESIRIRFENQALVQQLRTQTSIAEAARAEAELASLTKSQFLAAASHDLRQPLHALGLLAGTLSLTEPSPEPAIAGIRANVAALERLFSGLLDIAKLDAGLVQVERETVAVDALFDQLDFYLRPGADDLGLDLRLRSDGATAFTDPALIEQILLNLGTNALRNTHRGGVLIAARRRADGVRFEVWDTGSGIDPADIDRIFDEFVQLGNPERNRRKGMGLGLTIARRSARLLGDDIRVTSRLGHGSRFCFSQPLGSDDPVAADDRAAAGVQGDFSGLPVLVIDDDIAVREALGGLLEHWSVAATVVASLADARAAMRSRSYAVVLADHRLPGDESGLDFLIGLQGAGAPDSWLVTGDLDAALLARAKDAGIPVLDKPVDPDRLRSLLGNAAAQRANA